MNISPVRIYINGNGSISFFGPNNTLITNLQNLNGAKQANGQIIFEGDDKTLSFYVYQLTAIESATFSLPYSALDSRFYNPAVYSAKLNEVYQDVAEYVLVNKNGGASFVGGVVAVYPNYASFPATGQEAVIYIDEGTNQAYFWDGTTYQLLVSTGVQQYANFASFPVTGSANVIYIDMSTFEPYVWDGAAYVSLTDTATVAWGSITGTLAAQTDLQAALDDKVPYTGATGDVDLGEYELKAGQIEFDQTPTGTAGVGVMRWNDTDGTADLGLKGGNVTLQLGQEMVILAVNKSGVDLLEANYQAVRLRLVSEGGAAGQRLAVKLALADSDINSATTIGLVTETINNNQEGFITTVGVVREINTTGSLQGETWVDGDILYLSPTIAGQLTNVKPVAPDHLVVVGYVEYAHAIHGKIYVKCDNGYEIDELHNVYINSPTTWQVLRYDATAGYWTNSSLSASILPSGIDASKIGAGDVDNTEFGYLNGVTSSIQTQIDGKVPTTRSLTINGTTYDLSADRTWTIATGLTVGTTPIASGTVGRVLFEGTGNVLQESANLTWNNSTNVFGITGQIQVSTDVRLGATGILYWAGRAWIESTSSGNIRLTDSTNSSFDRLQFGGSTTAFPALKRSGAALCVVDAAGTSLSNLLIGTTTDAGFKLDVNGTARVSGALTVTTGGADITTGSATTFIRRSSTLHLGIGIAVDGAADFRINGTTKFYIGAAATNSLEIPHTLRVAFVNPGVATFSNILWSNTNTEFRLVNGANSDTVNLRASRFISSNISNTFDPSAQVQIDSTTLGFLPPRQTEAQRTAIASPAVGLIVYQTDLVEGLYIYKSTGWKFVA